MLVYTMSVNTSCDILQINLRDRKIIAYLINYKVYRNRKKIFLSMCNKTSCKIKASKKIRLELDLGLGFTTN